jgi:hypothetical protein
MCSNDLPVSFLLLFGQAKSKRTIQSRAVRPAETKFSAETTVALKPYSISKRQMCSNHLPVSFLLLFGQAKSKRTIQSQVVRPAETKNSFTPFPPMAQVCSSVFCGKGTCVYNSKPSLRNENWRNA